MIRVLPLLALWIAAPASVAQLAGPYQKWVDEDVSYIIRAEERAAYLSLRDDTERKHFIEQFWARRDPTPGTARNEFKEEHYRRIAYALDRFRDGNEKGSGWRSERGKTYILYGPPDELEVHRDKNQEQWLYRYLEGQGKNVIFTFTVRSRN